MSHLSIYINDIPINTSPDQTLDIEDKNPLFNDEEMFSYPIEVPFEGNRQVTKSLESPQSGIRPVDLEHSPMRVEVDGLPFRSGTAVVSDGEEMTTAASVSMEAAEQSFSDLISDLKCTDIPLADEIKIGEKLGEVTAHVKFETHIKVDIKNSGDSHRWYRNEVTRSFTPQALGFSQPFEMVSSSPAYSVREYHDGTVNVSAQSSRGKSFINISNAYEYGSRKNPYCNARVCYKHYALSDDGSTADGTVKRSDSAMQYEDIYPYWVLDADRPQSGLCFYVLYFLECLFLSLGVDYDLSNIAFGDFLRLCFFTTKCKYTERVNTSRYSLATKDAINTWLDRYGCGGQIEINDPDTKNLDQVTFSAFHSTYVVGENNVRSITVNTSIEEWSASAKINNMYATNENFPDMTVKSLLDSLENQFGIKFYYDYRRNKVTAYLLRDVFRSQNAPIKFAGSIDSIVPISEKITGVRCGYSDESDRDEQRANIKNGTKDYDTSYDYIDYRDGRVVVGTDLYKQIFKDLSSTDEKVYIDLSTGNKYRIKIDSGYTTNADMRPVLFEVGQWKGVEEGDCSKQNEDFVKELKSDLQPLPMNDVNYYRELDAMEASVGNVKINEGNESYYSSLTAKKTSSQPILCAFMDEDMEHEFVEQRINTLLDSGYSLTDIYATQVLKLVESYDPTGTDDGNSPLQSYDWGNAIAIMRGAGNDSGTQLFDYGYDGFDNSKWQQTVGQYALSTDTMDNFGNVYDYNGSAAGFDVAGSFSLKPRSYVSLPGVKVYNWDKSGHPLEMLTDTPLVRSDVGSAVAGDVIKYKSRGYVDQFLSELIYFYLHRKYFKITVKTTAAALADIPNHWRERWNIDGITGYINKVSYSVSQKTGIEQADIYLYAI